MPLPNLEHQANNVVSSNSPLSDCVLLTKRAEGAVCPVCVLVGDAFDRRVRTAR